MEQRKNTWVDVIVLSVAVLAVLFQIFPAKSKGQQTVSLILFISILLFVGLLSVVGWVTTKVKFYIAQIYKNTTEIKELKEEIMLQKKMSDIDKRISILESLQRNKKGNIDPKIVLLVIVLILFFFYLRSLGYI